MDDFGADFEDLDQFLDSSKYNQEDGVIGEDVQDVGVDIGLDKLQLESNDAADTRDADKEEQVDLNMDFTALGNVDLEQAVSVQPTSQESTVVYVEDVEAAEKMAADLGDLGDILGDLADLDDEVKAAYDKNIKAQPIKIQKAEAQPKHSVGGAAHASGAPSAPLPAAPVPLGALLPPPMPPPLPPVPEKGRQVVYSVYLVDGTNKKVSIDENLVARELLFSFAEKNRLACSENFGMYEQNENAPGRWLNLDTPLKDLNLKEWQAGAPESSDKRLICKIRYFKHLKKEFSDPVTEHLYYLQVKDDVASGKYYTGEGVAIRLGSYQIQEMFGDNQPGKHEPGFLDDVGLDKFIPPHLMKSNPSRYWQKRLFHLHRKYKGMSKEVAERKYLDLARGLPSFGASMFQVYSVGLPPQFIESPAILGVAEDGLIIMDNTHVDNGGMWNYLSFDQLRGWMQKEEDPRMLEIQKPNPQMEMLLDLLTFKADPRVVSNIVTMLNEYRYLLHPYRKDSLREADPTGKLSRSLPAPGLFEPPNKRSLFHPERSRLEVFKNEYIRSCISSNSKPLPRVYLRVDDALDNSTSVEHLDLTNCGLTLDSFAVLAKPINRAFTSEDVHKDEKFTENFNIKMLDLSGNELWPRGFTSLAMILESGTVSQLNLSKTKLNDSVDEFVDCMRMTMVNPQTNERVQNAGTITDLMLAENTLKQSSLQKILTCFKDTVHLTVLDIHDNGLEDSVIDALEPFLSNNRSALTSLDLSNNKLSDKGVIQLAQAIQKNDCSRLRTLALSSNRFSSKGAMELIQVIWKHGVLTSLKLSRNDLNAKFAMQLAELLSQKSFIKTLLLNNCSLEKKGCRAICMALGKNTSVSVLNLSNNDMDDEAAKALLASVGTNNRSLTSLTLMNNPLGSKGSGDVVKILNSNERITTLDLSFCKVGADQVKKLSDILITHHTLQILALIGNDLGKAGCKHVCVFIRGNSSLKKLFLDSNKFPEKCGKELAEALDENKTLTHLSLKDNLLDKEGILDLARNMPHNSTLVRIDLAANPGADYEAEIKEEVKKYTRCVFACKM